MMQSEEIRDACYMSEWNEYDPSVRKMLFIIMERAKRPVLLTAGKFSYLNIPTLVNVTKCLNEGIFILLIYFLIDFQICIFLFCNSSTSLQQQQRIIKHLTVV